MVDRHWLYLHLNSSSCASSGASNSERQEQRQAKRQQLAAIGRRNTTLATLMTPLELERTVQQSAQCLASATCDNTTAGASAFSQDTSTLLQASGQGLGHGELECGGSGCDGAPTVNVRPVHVGICALQVYLPLLPPYKVRRQGCEWKRCEGKEDGAASGWGCGALRSPSFPAYMPHGHHAIGDESSAHAPLLPSLLPSTSDDLICITNHTYDMHMGLLNRYQSAISGVKPLCTCVGDAE